MVLVDTSVWIDHFRNGNHILKNLLAHDEVAIHNYIIGELACGSLHNREEIIALLSTLSAVPIIDLDEYLNFIEINNLIGKGIGFVDINLLASSLLSDIKLWTLDRKLQKEANTLGIAYIKYVDS